MPKKVRTGGAAVGARDLQRVACGAPELGEIWSRSRLGWSWMRSCETAGRYMTRCGRWSTAAVLARSSGEEPASPRHRAGVASMAWRWVLPSSQQMIYPTLKNSAPAPANCNHRGGVCGRFARRGEIRRFLRAYYPGKIFGKGIQTTRTTSTLTMGTKRTIFPPRSYAAAPAMEEPIDEPLPADELPAAVADKVDDGDDFLAGIEDDQGLNTTAQEPPKSAEPSQLMNPSSDDDLSDVLADLDEDLPGPRPRKASGARGASQTACPGDEPAFAVVRTSRPGSMALTSPTPERSSRHTPTAPSISA